MDFKDYFNANRLSVGTNDLELLKRSLQNYLVATLISIITATIYFLLSPYQGTQSELLARTTPTLYDVLIAFVGIKLMRFRPKKFIDEQRTKIVHRTIISIVILTMIPAAFMTWKIMRQSLFDSQMN